MNIFRIMPFFLATLLIACTSHHNYPQNPAMAMCQGSCHQQLNHCRSLCINNCRHCSCVAARSTAKSYLKYKREQCIQGRVIARRLNSYRDPLQCCKMTCDCFADFKLCMRSCGAKILIEEPIHGEYNK